MFNLKESFNFIIYNIITLLLNMSRVVNVQIIEEG